MPQTPYPPPPPPLPPTPALWRRIIWGEGAPRFNAADDEGTPLFIPDDLWIKSMSADASRSALRAHAAIYYGSSWAYISNIPAMFFGICIALFSMATHPHNLPMNWFIFAVLAFTVVSLPIYSRLTYWWTARWSRRDAEAMSAAGLAQGCCPRCLHDLVPMREVAIEQDLPIVPCERCNAGWRTDRIRVPADIMRQPPSQDSPPPNKQGLFRNVFSDGEARTGAVRDAQEIPVPLWQPNFSARDIHTLSPDELLVLRQKYASDPGMESFSAQDRRVLVYYAIAFVIVGTIAVILSFFDSLQFLIVLLAVAYLFALLIGGLLLVEIHKQRATTNADRRRADGILSNNLCPSCGTDLRRAETDNQGQTTCPTCAAVWNIK